MLPNPRDIHKRLKQMAGLLTLRPSSERLPNNISDMLFTLSKAAYSCGTVGDSHPIPLPNAMQRYEEMLNYQNKRGIIFLSVS